MKSLLILGLLCALTIQQTVLVSSNADSTMVIDPSNGVTVLVKYFNQHYANYIGYDAKWIYKNGEERWPCEDYAIFFTQFYVDCTTGPTTLIITADDEFSASVNGGSAFTGCDWHKIFKFDITSQLQCGVNNLTIKVTNKEKHGRAALIFAVIQDQSNCYQCSSPLSFYDRKTCQCECIDHCNCTSINPCYTFFDYPVCGCKCKKIETCLPYHFFNEDTCKCECKPVVCLPGHKQDCDSCLCVPTCPIQKCCDQHIWNPFLCKCVCQEVEVCKANEYWDEEKCECKCKENIRTQSPHH